MLSESATSSGSLVDLAYSRVSGAILLDETSVDIYKYGQNVTCVDQSTDWGVNVTFGVHSVKSYAPNSVSPRGPYHLVRVRSERMPQPT